MSQGSGFTLWELLCTLAIGAVTLGAGAPAFSAFVLDARLKADVNAWVLAVQVARSEAAKRGRPVVLCRTADTAACLPLAARAPAGWMVFVNADGRDPPSRAADEPLVFAHTAALAGTIAGNRAHYEFRPGRRSTNGTTVFCDRRGAAAARAVIVSYTGRPRIDSRDGDGRPLRCEPSP